MRKKVKSGALVFCLFVFLLIVLGGGLRLNPAGAFMAAVTGTPLLIYVFQCLVMRSATFNNQHSNIEDSYGEESATVSRRG
jgi:hypothetical protein